MRQFDLTPLYRSTVGFDRLFTLLDTVAGANDASGFPPYNIERLGENEYRISMAVAGFSRNDLKIDVKENVLSVRGEKAEDQSERRFLHRGIATRSFERKFELADHVEVTGAELVDGMLDIDLKREVPEKLKPRVIAIGGGRPKTIEHASAA